MLPAIQVPKVLPELPSPREILKPKMSSSFQVTSVGRIWIHGEIILKMPTFGNARGEGTWTADKSLRDLYKVKAKAKTWIPGDIAPWVFKEWGTIRLKVKTRISHFDPMSRMGIIAPLKIRAQKRRVLKLRRSGWLNAAEAAELKRLQKALGKK